MVRRILNTAAAASTIVYTLAIALLPALPYDARTTYALLGLSLVALVLLVSALAVELARKEGR